MIQLLESQLPADRICQLLGICTTTKETLDILNSHKKPAQDLDFGIDKCSVCTEVVTLAEGALKQNKTEQEIENVVNQLCASEHYFFQPGPVLKSYVLFPAVIDNSPLKQFGSVCHEIAANIPLLIQLIESEVPPSQVCSLLKFCSSKVLAKALKVKAAAIDKCTICEEVVGVVEGALQKNSTETEIENLLNGLCSGECGPRPN